MVSVSRSCRLCRLLEFDCSTGLPWNFLRGGRHKTCKVCNICNKTWSKDRTYPHSTLYRNSVHQDGDPEGNNDGLMTYSEHTVSEHVNTSNMYSPRSFKMFQAFVGLGTWKWTEVFEALGHCFLLWLGWNSLILTKASRHRCVCVLVTCWVVKLVWWTENLKCFIGDLVWGNFRRPILGRHLVAHQLQTMPTANAVMALARLDISEQIGEDFNGNQSIVPSGKGTESTAVLDATPRNLCA